MVANPSRPLRDMKQSTELPVVQIVPVTAADDRAIAPREAGDRPVHVGLPEHLVLVRVLGGLARRVERVESRAGPAIRSASLRAIVATQGCGRSGV